MIAIPEKTVPALSAKTIGTYKMKITPAYNSGNIGMFGKTAYQDADRTTMNARSARREETVEPAVRSTQTASVNPMPQLTYCVQRGQKMPLQIEGRECLSFGCGWNVKDTRIDMDISAFLLTANGRVPGDDWFVFYGSDLSPDGSVAFSNASNGYDRETIRVDLSKLRSDIERIVFVLTINEAIENGLNFSGVAEAYVRVMNEQTGRELVSFKADDCSCNVTSMTLCELYRKNGQWRFSAVGNGVKQDLAGQCAIYGVNISD